MAFSSLFDIVERSEYDVSQAISRDNPQLITILEIGDVH
jgi:hypothetical protein